MSKLRYIIVVLLAISFIRCDNLEFTSDQDEKFVKFYGSFYRDIGNDVKVFNGGYLILATKTITEQVGSTTITTTAISLIKTDKFGNNIKLNDDFNDLTKGGGDDLASQLLLTSDGGVLVLGTFDDTLNNNTDIFLRKYGASLTEEWTKYYNTPTNANEEGTVIKKASSGYIIAGSTTETADGTKDIYLVKIDDNGNVEWTENHGYGGNDFSGDLLVLDDGYLIIGTTFDDDYANNIVTVKTNFRGISPDTKIYLVTSNVFGRSGMKTDDGGYLIVGTADDVSGNNSNVYVIKVQDNIHEIDWSQTYGGSGLNQGFDVIKSNGGYAVVGSKTVSSGIAGYFLKIDSDSEILAENTYGGYTEQIIHSIEKTSDGGYIMVGSSGFDGNEMICLIKV
ncbi:MAG: hypothetical protein KAQ75_13940, partial [Bacteroidales bacterium]|nr:hypothetical protein [Bacteroidales bacterium]